MWRRCERGWHHGRDLGAQRRQRGDLGAMLKRRGELPPPPQAVEAAGGVCNDGGVDERRLVVVGANNDGSPRELPSASQTIFFFSQVQRALLKLIMSILDRLIFIFSLDIFKTLQGRIKTDFCLDVT